MNHDAEYYDTLIELLDEGPFEVTKWEADFLARLLENGGRLTERQQAVLENMAEKYGVEP